MGGPRGAVLRGRQSGAGSTDLLQQLQDMQALRGCTMQYDGPGWSVKPWVWGATYLATGT